MINFWDAMYVINVTGVPIKHGTVIDTNVQSDVLFDGNICIIHSCVKAVLIQNESQSEKECSSVLSVPECFNIIMWVKVRYIKSPIEKDRFNCFSQANRLTKMGIEISTHFSCGCTSPTRFWEGQRPLYGCPSPCMSVHLLLCVFFCVCLSVCPSFRIRNVFLN